MLLLASFWGIGRKKDNGMLMGFGGAVIRPAVCPGDY